jgi:hypothetical protein
MPGSARSLPSSRTHWSLPRIEVPNMVGPFAWDDGTDSRAGPLMRQQL